MEKRRRYKRNAKKYHQLNRIVKLLCIEAKENFLNTKWEKIEQTLNCTPKECHRLLREVTGKGRAKHEAAILKDEMGKTLYEQTDKLSRWERYVASLYRDPNRDKKTIAFEGQLSGEPIMRKEVEYALKCMRPGKACGKDGISADFLQKNGEPVIDFLVTFFNKVYEKGKLPDELTQSIFVPLAKKARAKDCSDFRTIALMSHGTKVLQKVLLNRVKKELRAKINE